MSCASIPDCTPRPACAARREQSLGEEIANSVTHGVGGLLALAGTVVLVSFAWRTGDPWRVAAVTVYGLSMVLLYVSSTIYHALAHNRAKAVFRVLDHASIYALIAGTYTPFTLVALRGAWGWSLFGVAWTLAATGIALEACLGARVRALSVVVYIALGWMVLLATRPLVAVIGTAGMTWLAAGGLAYTAGTGFYAWKRLRYAHMVWHLFVVAGSVLQFVAVWPLVR